MSRLIKSNYKIISQVESFLCPYKKETLEEGWRIQQPKHCVSTNNNKDEDNSLKNHNQNNAPQASSQKFRQIIKISNINLFIDY